ncbi:hypothetical protein GCM10008096_20610 [Zhihengliuella salsuginis]|uniref:Uncharacterized protein n=1 Tax=Zhihengliuella salsuginis TaxID=578222 RepID=A0ABQ3GIE4_9MICC|nr:hypothetical protein GCM10008096_20610 [Zhihengliuella salsuginis]
MSSKPRARKSHSIQQLDPDVGTGRIDTAGLEGSALAGSAQADGEDGGLSDGETRDLPAPDAALRMRTAGRLRE